jgi:hypothetical protein
MKNLCVFCWREKYVSRKRNYTTSYFCKEHMASNDTNKIYMAGRRKLLKALKKKGFEIPEKFPKKKYYNDLYELAYQFTNDPKNSLPSIDFSSLGTKKQIHYVVNTISVSYPNIINNLTLAGKDNSNVLKTSDLFAFTDSFLSLLGLKDISVPIPFFLERALNHNPRVWAEHLIEHIARYDAFVKIDNFLNECASEIGRPRDTELRRKIKLIILEKQLKNEKVKQKDVAKDLGLSPPRVSKLFKEIGIT